MSVIIPEILPFDFFSSSGFTLFCNVAFSLATSKAYSIFGLKYFNYSMKKKANKQTITKSFMNPIKEVEKFNAKS